MTEDKNIPKTPSPSDYDGLRDYGLEYIRKVGSRYWTDFHVHDPGVTILEALTLAVNDLSYRSSASMADLLTRKGSRQVSLEGTMFPADIILANAPTTPDDYRKLVLENIPGVRNVWFTPVRKDVDVPHIPKRLEAGTVSVNGYYDVTVELEDSYKDREGCERAIRNQFVQHRNLCENILGIRFMEQARIGLCAEIEIESGVDMRVLLQEIYDRMCDYVSPTIPFHTVEELLSMGREPKDIFSVSAPKLGFIDREELVSFDRKTVLYTSDVIAILMEIKGVRSVHHIHFIVDETSTGERIMGRDTGKKLEIPADEAITFTFVPDFQRNIRIPASIFVNSIIFCLNGLTFLPPTPKGKDGIRVQARKDERVSLKDFSKSMPVPEGSYRDTDRYFSFQNIFPTTYRMGVDTLPESASALRKAERMQLKAYLTFFDQTLSDYLAQLDRFLDLLSVKTDDPQSNATYFHGKLTDDEIIDVSKVLRYYPDYPIPAEDFHENMTRKDKVLNHLLSRFAESFAEYASLEFIRNHADDDYSITETVEDKKRFLEDYPRISSQRSRGLDWTGEDSVTGAERRIMRRLGIDRPDARGRLSEGNELGLYVLEHSLFSPDTPEDGFLEIAQEEGTGVLLRDPYSFRVTVVLPAWTDLSSNLDYRRYAEKIIREEIPAHISVRTCWISREVMSLFEDTYLTWLSVIREGTLPPVAPDWDARHTDANTAMVAVFRRFENVYPEVSLVDEDIHEYDEIIGTSRLDSMYLGSGFGLDSASNNSIQE